MHVYSHLYNVYKYKYLYMLTCLYAFYIDVVLQVTVQPWNNSTDYEFELLIYIFNVFFILFLWFVALCHIYLHNRLFVPKRKRLHKHALL